MKTKTWATLNKPKSLTNAAEAIQYFKATPNQWQERLIWLIIGATLFITAERLFWLSQGWLILII